MFHAVKLVPLLTELGDPGDGGYYKHRTPTGLPDGTLSYALNCQLSSPSFNYTHTRVEVAELLDGYAYRAYVCDCALPV
jgi:hypothetical protein